MGYLHRCFLFLFLPTLLYGQERISDTVTLRLITCEGKAQGTYYLIKYLSADTVSLQGSIDSIFGVIDRSLSLYKPGSLINRFNSEGAIEMDEHMGNVIRKALSTSQATGGSFDITVKPLVDLWGFGVVKPSFQGVPPADSIRHALTYIGSRYLKIQGHRLITTRKGVQIDCNGIAQGYTVDVLGRFLASRGISNYLVDVGGELCARGYNRQHKTWRVGIERPAPGDTTFEPVQGIVELDNKGIATSGNYRRFFDQGGTRFAHTIDPRSGQALHNHIISVTVMAPDCITADAFDNPLILMGVEAGIRFVETHPAYGLEAWYIYRDEHGIIQERGSSGFSRYFSK